MKKKIAYMIDRIFQVGEADFESILVEFEASSSALRRRGDE